MLGKKSGIGSRLRNLLAKIQREFHYPKVFAVRLHTVATTNTWQDGPGPAVFTVTQPVAITRDASVCQDIALTEGHVVAPGVHLSQPLDQMQTSSHSVTCWEQNSIDLHQPDLGTFALPQVHDVLMAATPIHVKQLSCELDPPTLRPTDLIADPQVLGDRNLAARFPYRLRVIPMKSLPMKLQIRYRAQALKNSGLKLNQVIFVGICPSLPSAPLKMVDYETDDLDGFHYAFAARTGRFNSYLGSRIWVIIQIKGQPEYLPIMAKEE